jgi:pimeloyl-ACP methyl ester carboxylesterase
VEASILFSRLSQLSSGLAPFTDDITLRGLSVRVIAPDRPGYGLSDLKQARKLLDWPEDAAELADNLLMDRFAVLGISRGGPYAVCCAHQPTDRLSGAAIVSGMGPSCSSDPQRRNATI